MLSGNKDLNFMNFKKHYFARQPHQAPFQLQNGNIYEDVSLFLIKNLLFLEFPRIFKASKN